MTNKEIKMVLDAVATRVGAYWGLGGLFVGSELVATCVSGSVILPPVYDGLDMAKTAMNVKPSIGSEQIAALIFQRWPHIGCAALAA